MEKKILILEDEIKTATTIKRLVEKCDQDTKIYIKTDLDSAFGFQRVGQSYTNVLPKYEI